jgi:hypothetical protein
VYAVLPPALQALVEEGEAARDRITTAAADESIAFVSLDAEFYRGDAVIMPKRIAVINTIG